MNESREYWETGDEIKFLKTTIPVSMSKLQFLRNYKEASQYRHNWGSIKKKDVFKAIDKEIIQLQKGEY